MQFQTFIDRIYAFLTKRVVYHSLFWLLLFIVQFTAGLNAGEWHSVLWNELISLVFYAILVYVNLLFLIPNYLANRAGRYFLYLILACLLITPIKVLTYFLLFSERPLAQQQLIAQQGTIFLGFLVIAALSTLLRVLTDWWRHQQERQELRTRSMQTELRFLRSQINPHFLFNTLNNLYALTLKKSDKAPEIVLKLSEIMRYMLYECNEKEVLLANEVQYVQNYLDLERLRQPEGAVIEFEVCGNVGTKKIVPLLFVPFLENSFKHGMNHHIREQGFVRAKLEVLPEEIHFFIENSKTDSLVQQHNRKSGGIGLVNVRQRLKLLYPDQHKLTMQDEPNRFTVDLRVFF